MAAIPKSETPSTSRHCWLRLEMLGGFVFGIWNNVSTALNAMTLYEKNHTGFAALTIFFLVRQVSSPLIALRKSKVNTNAL